MNHVSHRFPMRSSEHLSEVFGRCVAEGLTGVLQVRHGRVERRIYWREGAVCYAESDLLNETLGHYLRRCGALTALEHERVKVLQRRRGVRQGEALLEQGLLTPGQLYHYLRAHVREKIIHAFAAEESEAVMTLDADVVMSKPCFVYNVFELIVDGLQARSHSEVAWPELALRYVRPVDISPQRWAHVRQAMPSGLFSRIQEGCCVEDLFDREWSDAHKMSALRGLLALRLIEIDHAVPVSETSRVNLKTLAKLKPAKVQMSTGEVDASGEAILRSYLRMTDATPCAVLGVSSGASLEEVGEAYTQLKQRYAFSRYPDLADGFMCKLVELHNLLDRAFETLSTWLQEKDGEAPCSPSQRPKCVQVQLLEAESAYLAGLAELAASRYTQALSHFQHAQRLHPGEPLFLLHEGWAHVCLSSTRAEREEGASLIRTALSLNPMMAEGYYCLARIAARRYDIAEVLKYLARCLEIQPEHGLARGRLAEISQPVWWKKDKGVGTVPETSECEA